MSFIICPSCNTSNVVANKCKNCKKNLPNIRTYKHKEVKNESAVLVIRPETETVSIVKGDKVTTFKKVNKKKKPNKGNPKLPLVKKPIQTPVANAVQRVVEMWDGIDAALKFNKKMNQKKNRNKKKKH